MANNRTKIDQLHDLMPAHFNTRGNPNWNAVIEAIGEQDQKLMDLLEAVKQQFFIKTASRPYLDNLAANVGVTRPKLVGMTDNSFQKFIPVMSYKPKQVRLIINQLLDVFYFKESTTAYSQSTAAPFAMTDGHNLTYLIDEQFAETIFFFDTDFVDPANATATEIAAVINRQAKNSFAIDRYDNATKLNYVEIFTKSIGSVGSVRITGGFANNVLRFNGYITSAGNGSNTQWTISRTGDKVSMQFVGGTNPGINNLKIGDIMISHLPGVVANLLPQVVNGNEGSFAISDIDIAAGILYFTNLFAVPGTYTQTSATDVKFFTPIKNVAFTSSNRAGTWEVLPGQVTIELPNSPPIVRRSLIGSQHVNGSSDTVTSITGGNTINLVSGRGFPLSGNFYLRPQSAVTSVNGTSTSKGRLIGRPVRYSYTTRSAASVTGDTTEGSNVITNISSMVGIAVGQNVFADGVPQYAFVVGIFLSTVTLSHPATITATSVSMQFGGNVLQGITPALPAISAVATKTLSSLTRTSNIVTAVTSTANNYYPGMGVNITGSTGIPMVSATGDISVGLSSITSMSSTVGIAVGQLIINTNVPAGTKVTGVGPGSIVFMSNVATGTAVGATISFNDNVNGARLIQSATSSSFTFVKAGVNGSAVVAGSSSVESTGFASAGADVFLSESQPESVTRIKGSYAWDLNAPYVLSANSGQLTSSIVAGTTVPVLNLNSSTIPLEGGFLIFDYGLNTQEGPIKYLYASSSNSVVIDQSYVFQYSHSIGSKVIALSRKGPHIMSGLGTEYAAYMTNPPDVRVTLENLIKSVASAGIYTQFLIKFPEQIYIGGPSPYS
jgi:hypothetical protein